MSRTSKPPAAASTRTRALGRPRGSSASELLLGLVVAAVGAAARLGRVGLGRTASRSRTATRSRSRSPADAPILKDGDAVRVAGQLAGLITDVEPDDGARAGHGRAAARVRAARAATRGRTSRCARSSTSPTSRSSPATSTTRCPRAARSRSRAAAPGVDLLEVVQLFDRRARGGALRHGAQRRRSASPGAARTSTRRSPTSAPRSADLTSQLEAATARAGRDRGDRRRRRRAPSAACAARAPDDVGGLIGSGERRGRRASPPRRPSSARRSSCCARSRTSCSRPRRSPTRCSTTAAPATRELTPAARELAEALPRGQPGARARRPRSAPRPCGSPARSTRCSAAAAPVLRDLQPTVASIKPLLGPLRKLVDGVEPYASDIRLAGEGIISATDNSIPVARRRPGTRRCASPRCSPATAAATPTRSRARPWSTRSHAERRPSAALLGIARSP